MSGHKLTILDLLQKKHENEKITRAVCWDYPMARIAEDGGVDMILVGDSLGMVIMGYPNTLPVTMEDMIHHCAAVTRACSRCFVVGDLPFLSYEASAEQAVMSAGRLLKIAGVDAVKIEGGRDIVDKVCAISKAGIPVHGHIGLTPQKIKQLGGFRTQGTSIESAIDLFRDAAALVKAGCFAITLECAPPILGKMMSKHFPSVVIVSAGSGPYCDAQSVNLYDMVGLTQAKTPKFSKKYSDAGRIIKASVEQFCIETKSGVFPGEENCYTISEELSRKIETEIGKIV